LTFAETPTEPCRELPLGPGHIVHVKPGQVHRIQAVTDLVLLEVSTPELDDVIRIEDDADRGNGRILREHEN
jgi:mannose-6-phosphate isomerase